MNEQIIEAIANAFANGYKVRVVGIAQNARNGKVESVCGYVSKVGGSVFYVGAKRFRPFLNLTEIRVIFEVR